jgi:serine/threonine-protein kinase
VHRDLKPANLFVTRDSDGESLVKVLDLGICKLVERTDELSDTTTYGMLGTLAYMAPEQLETPRRADTRSDIWSLGVILYELVTGRVPFHGHTQVELHARASREPYPPMDGVTTDFETIVARCLAKDPAARFQLVTDLVAALAPFAQCARTVSGAIPLRIGASRRGPRRSTLTAFIVAAFATMGILALGSSLRAVSVTAAKPAETPRPTSSPELGRAPNQPMPVLLPSALTSTQPVPAPAASAPAASAPARSTSAQSDARTARARHNSLHPSVAGGAAPETTPPRASVDPLSTSY